MGKKAFFTFLCIPKNQCAFTPSIARRQFTVDMAKNENAELELQGRHDPCVVHRAVPVIEAAAALAACELMGV